jgi:hypothetical protein
MKTSDAVIVVVVLVAIFMAFGIIVRLTEIGMDPE